MPQDCLDENGIVSLFEGRAGRDATEHVDEHLAECAACRRLVAEYAALAPVLRATLPVASRPRIAAASPAPPHDPQEIEWRLACAEAARRAAGARARVGSVLAGKYRIDGVLGVGGMGVVYRATHRNEAEFAIKMLHPELSVRAAVHARFLREGKAANSVKHGGVVFVVDDDVADDGSAFLVMELLRGVSVQEAWERLAWRLPVPCVLSIAEQLLDVLGAAHARGIVHRDLKPANLFLTREGVLKVLDFGIARVRDVAATHEEGGTTGAGMLLGTPEYMAPEQAFARPSEVDGRTDLWAVGATLFALLTGECVHAGDNASQIMVRAATERARPLASVCPGIPSSVAEVIDLALSFEKAERWPSASTMREAILRASVESSGEEPARAVLEELVGSLEREDPETAHEVVARARTLWSSGPPPAPGALAVAPALGSNRATKRPVALRLVGAGAVVIAAGLGVRALVSGDAATAVASSPPPAAVVASSVNEARAAPAAPLAAAIATETPSPQPVSNPPALPRAPLATPAPRPRPATSTGAHAPSPSTKPAGCDPDFTYDANGNKIFKPECFGP